MTKVGAGAGVTKVAATVGPSFSQVQKVSFPSASSVSPQTFTWSSGPIQNNLLILCCSSDNTVTTPSGYTLAKSNVSAQGQYIFYRIAGASESTTVSITLGGADSLVGTGFEYSGMLTSGTLDVSASILNSSGTNSAPTGTTASVAQTNELAIALICWNATTEGALAVNSWSNSFVQEATVVSTGSAQNIRQTSASLNPLALTTQTTTAALSGNTISGSQGIIVTFKTL